jgi:uncharacterized protein YeaO (DUF488 family)
MVRVKRVYEEPAASDGSRFLVDRLWPRGVTKKRLALDDWLKEVGPSDRLRKWFGHDPKKWKEFRKRYFAELHTKAESWQPIVERARRSDVTLLYGARDPEHNNAVALRDFVNRKIAQKKMSSTER